MAIPVLDKISEEPIAIISVYNCGVKAVEKPIMHLFAATISTFFYRMNSLSGLFQNNDLLESAFNLVNDGVVFVDQS